MPRRRLVKSDDIQREKLLRARELRREATPHEVLLWEHLRRGACGFHFRRQQVIEGFIADFLCASARVVVELDGAVHDSQPDEDVHRDSVLAARRILVLRFRNDDVEQGAEDVVRRIAAACREWEQR